MRSFTSITRVNVTVPHAPLMLMTKNVPHVLSLDVGVVRLVVEVLNIESSAPLEQNVYK